MPGSTLLRQKIIAEISNISFQGFSKRIILSESRGSKLIHFLWRENLIFTIYIILGIEFKFQNEGILKGFCFLLK